MLEAWPSFAVDGGQPLGVVIRHFREALYHAARRGAARVFCGN
jgi:hypothetical protein